MSVRDDRDAAIVRELDLRLDRLRQQPFDSLNQLPEIHDEEIEILGESILFSVFRERRDDGSLLLVVRADQCRPLGFTWAKSRGFRVMPTGEQRLASPDELD